MRKRYYILAFFIFFLCASTWAQQQERPYGKKVEGNFNLRFRELSKASWEMYAGVLGGSQGFGGQLGVAYMLHPSSNFAWGGGVEGCLTSKEHYGALADAMARLSLRLGNRAFFGASGLFGAGQLPFEDHSSNEAIQGVAVYYSSAWRTKVGGEVEIGFKAGKTVMVSAFGRYTHGFASSNTRTAQVWVQKPVENHADAVSGGVRLSLIF
jgi:hypothetical protein